MQPGFIDITGERFGRWTVLSHSHYEETRHDTMWRVRCECGTISLVGGAKLRCGASQGCTKCHLNDVTTMRKEQDRHG